MPGLSMLPFASPCTLDQRSAMLLITPIKNLSSLAGNGDDDGQSRGGSYVIEQRNRLIYQRMYECKSDREKDRAKTERENATL